MANWETFIVFFLFFPLTLRLFENLTKGGDTGSSPWSCSGETESCRVTMTVVFHTYQTERFLFEEAAQLDMDAFENQNPVLKMVQVPCVCLCLDYLEATTVSSWFSLVVSKQKHPHLVVPVSGQ